jgi:hypothetical protein
MVAAPLYYSWLVKCEDPKEAEKLRQQLPGHITLDAAIEVSAGPSGSAESGQIQPHRLGDYFAAIRLLPGPVEDPAALRILFHRRQDVGRYWKDLMAYILQDIREMARSATIAIDYKGNEEPVSVVKASK